MDGYGLRRADSANAVTLANAPHLDAIFNSYPHATLKTSGLDVGLPEGQMGNSEVGHMNLGAGRIVYQDITRIDTEIESGQFFNNSALLDLIHDLKRRDRYLHLFGLVSTGGVHASMNHLRATLELCCREEFFNVVLDAFTDGRDTPPHAGAEFVHTAAEWMRELRVGRIATVSGRYYAMDRDKRWDRIERAYRAICFGEGEPAESAVAGIKASYAAGVTDEFIVPFVIDYPEGPTPLTAEDGVFFFNFRADRTRQLTDSLTDPNFAGFVAPIKVPLYVTMTRYREDYEFPIVSHSQSLHYILGEMLAKVGMKQFRIAETEKYAHVTYFFNGREETPFPGEDRVLIPSPRVATYDLQPEMSAPLVTEKVCEAVASEKYNFILVNYANCDMVGHSGIVAAAVQAVEAVDRAVGKLWETARTHGYAMLLTSDHGNAEELWDESTHGPHTAHTTNPVPIVLLSDPHVGKIRDGGRLADIAPTVLDLLMLPVPFEMTGKSLLIR
jgi:2,3-bisphosphoglycerate-independent phosphoglycerate mutase